MTNWRLFFGFVIRHSSFVIRHSSFVIRHSSFPSHSRVIPESLAVGREGTLCPHLAAEGRFSLGGATAFDRALSSAGARSRRYLRPARQPHRVARFPAAPRSFVSLPLQETRFNRR